MSGSWPGVVPGPVATLLAALPHLRQEDLLPPGAPVRVLPEQPDSRDAAVLIALSPGAGTTTGTDRGPTADRTAPATDGAGVDVVLIERAAGGVHGGQVAFPGGAAEPGDGSPAATALREAHEEVGLDIAGTHVLGVLPTLPVPVSRFVVTPVLAWEPHPSPLLVGDPFEVGAVRRVPLAELADPARRRLVRSPARSPGFALDGVLVWGFTALLLDAVLRHAGLAVAWDGALEVDAPTPRYRRRPRSASDPSRGSTVAPA